MKTKNALVLGLAIAIGAAIVGNVARNHRAEPPAASVRISQSAPAPAAFEPPHPPQIPVAETAPPVQTTKDDAPPVEVTETKVPPAVSPPNAQPQTGRPANPKETIQDPYARLALSFVGADPAAEDYWVAAVNDPNLDAHERQDLIEDLNEDGLSDPKHPGPEDLSLILNRLDLIEELAPYAMDQVNADAFAEAHKDLVDMLDGKPVQ